MTDHQTTPAALELAQRIYDAILADNDLEQACRKLALRLAECELAAQKQEDTNENQ